MQSLPDLQEKIFFEVKNILESLSRIESPEELLRKHDLFSEVADRISFLRILDKNKDSLVSEWVAHQSDNEEINLVSNIQQVQVELNTDGHHFQEEIIEEEVLFTNELNEISIDHGNEQQSLEQISPAEEFEVQEETPVDDITPEIELNSDTHNQALEEAEERKRQILDIPKIEAMGKSLPQTETGTREETASEKKFRLASIKALKTVQNIFDEDPLEQLAEKQTPTASAYRSSVPTEYMEAPKAKPEFRLDLNDRVAFTKLLFNGNEEELKKVVDQLNSFTDLEEARSYLSDVYYQKDWRKVDEYAQRLWSLVENKFL